MPHLPFAHPFSPSGIQDPYPTYAWLAAHDPLHDDEVTGTVLLTRLADCDALLRHRDATCAQDERGTRLPPSMLTTDPPEHTRLRAIGTRLLSAAAVERMRAGLAADVGSVLANAGDEPDAYDDLGLPLSVRVLARLLDVPDDDRDTFAQLASAAGANIDPTAAGPAAGRAAAALAFYLRGRLAVSPELQQWVADAGCTGAEAVSVLSLCVVGGLEPLAAVVAAAVVEAAEGAPSGPGGAAEVEDVLRRHTPIPLVARATPRGVDLPSGAVPAGRRVLALLDAANHDATESSTQQRHLSFGAGPHFCLGAPLVRTVLGLVLDGCADLDLAPVSEPRAYLPAVIPRRRHPLHVRVGRGASR